MRRVANRVQTDSTDVLDELGYHTPDTAGEIGVEAERAARVLAQLRPEQRKVIELGLLHGLSHADIASATGMPLGTVKTFMRRGLIQMRQMMGIEPAPAGESEA
jgi:RNA polymerase sigma-70 factor (ECF subfamily)